MSARLHITLELEAAVQPISGSLRSPGCKERRFVGWTDLFAALEATRQRAQSNGFAEAEFGGGTQEKGRARR